MIQSNRRSADVLMSAAFVAGHDAIVTQTVSVGGKEDEKSFFRN